MVTSLRKKQVAPVMLAAQADLVERVRAIREPIFGFSMLVTANILVVMLHAISGWATFTKLPFQVGKARVGDAAERGRSLIQQAMAAGAVPPGANEQSTVGSL
jgi:hypothetical protein